MCRTAPAPRCISRGSVVPRGPKLRLRFAKPSESQGSRSRFHCRNALKQLTRNTIAKKQAGQEDTDSDYLFGDCSQRAVSRFGCGKSSVIKQTLPIPRPGPSPRGWGRNPMKELAAMMTPGSSTLFVPGDKSYARQCAGRAYRNRRPYLKDLALQRRRGQAAGCVVQRHPSPHPAPVSRGPGRMDSMSFSRNWCVDAHESRLD